MNILVVTLTCNRKDVTEQWLGQLRRKAGCAFKHLVVDNGSTDGTVDWLKANHYSVLENKDNVGIMEAWKQAYENAIDDGFYPDFIVKFDDDCEIITPNILKKMLYFMKGTHGEYIAAPMDDNIDPEYTPKMTEPDIKQVLGFPVRITTHIGGMLMMCSKEAFEKLLEVGGVQSDADRGTYWREHGYKMVYLTELHAAHQGMAKSTPKETYKF